MLCLQVPIYEMRNDGRDNLLGALLIAGQFVIPEVRKWRRDMHAARIQNIRLFDAARLHFLKRESQVLFINLRQIK